MRIKSFKDHLSCILIIALMVTLTISILYVSSGVIGAVENYKKGNNIAGGTTPSYGNMTINQGYEKDGDRGSYLQGGYAAPQNQWVILDLGSYKSIYSIYWKFGRTFYGYISQPCHLSIHESDGWHTIDTEYVDPDSWSQNEVELNGQLVNEVEFTGDSFYDSGQFAQWRVYEIEIYEALPWPPIIISISPISQQGEQGEMLSYIVTVKNIGTEDNSYNLIVSDNMNWNLAPDDNRFDNVAPGENMVTTLRVTIPENAIPDEIDNITVTATSLTDNTVTASSSCTAQAKLRVRLDIGWNLVCFTGVAENDTLNNIFVGLDYNVDYLMYYWSAPGGPYTGMNPSQPLKDNTGYWVQMITTSKVVNTTGTQPDTENIDLALGWNLVGFPVVNGTTTPNKIFAPLIYTTDYLMYYWTAPFGPYSGVNPALALEDNTGYWILIDLNKTVTVP